MDLVTNDRFDLLACNALRDSVLGAELLSGAEARLCVTDMPYDRNTPLDSLIGGEASFPGYAAKAVTWAPAGKSGDGTIMMLGTTTPFVDTGDSVENQIYGLFLTNDAAPDTLIGCARFDGAPLPMVDNTGRILVTIEYTPLQGAKINVIE